MTNTINLDNDEIIDILVKNFYEFPTTDTRNVKWYQETSIPFNNYLLGDDIFIQSIPDNPDFNNGTPRDASFVGLVNSDFYEYNNDPNDIQKCSIVDDTTGTVRRFRYLKLDPCPNQTSPKSWYKINTSKIIVTADSIQFNYKSNDDLSPYMYNIWTQESVRTGDLLPFGSNGGNYIFNVKTGVLLFVDYDNFEFLNVEQKFKVHSQNVPVITFYKYIGTKGIKNLTPIVDNLNPSLHTLTVSNNLIVLGDTSLNTLTANDVSFNTLNIYNTLTVSNQLIVYGETSLNTLIANDVSFNTLDIYNILTVSNELHLNTIKSYNKNSSIDDTFEPITTYTNILDLTDFSDIIYTNGSNRTSINGTVSYLSYLYSSFTSNLIGITSGITSDLNTVIDDVSHINNVKISDLYHKFILLESSFHMIDEDVSNNKTNISNIGISFESISVRFTDMERDLTLAEQDLTDLSSNIRDLSTTLTQFIDDFTSPTQNLNDLIEISNNNIIKNTDISQILVHDTSIHDCRNTIYVDISNRNSNNNVLVNVNLNYRCSYGYKERIKIFLFKDDGFNIEGKQLLESAFLGTEMGTIYQGNYSCSYLDNKDFDNPTTKYYIKFQLEGYDNHGNGQGIIDINTSSSLSAINFNI